MPATAAQAPRLIRDADAPTPRTNVLRVDANVSAGEVLIAGAFWLAGDILWSAPLGEGNDVAWSAAAVVDAGQLDRQAGAALTATIAAELRRGDVTGRPTWQLETIKTDGYNDWWTCLCDNDPGRRGFAPCDGQGNEVAEDEWAGKLSVCGGCGRIIDQDTYVQATAPDDDDEGFGSGAVIVVGRRGN